MLGWDADVVPQRRKLSKPKLKQRERQERVLAQISPWTFGARRPRPIFVLAIWVQIDVSLQI